MKLELIIVFLISLLLGSFYNVIGMRMLSKENIILGRSHCTTCNKKLSPIDMIPCISYMFYLGKCRYCKGKISYVYFFGELITAISYTLIIYKYGWTEKGLINLVFITIMIISSITDLKERIVPNEIILTGIIIIFVIRFYYKLDWINYLFSGVKSFSVLYLIFKLSGEKMGGADVKIYALIGMSIGFLNSMLNLFYASFIALIICGIKFIFGKEIIDVEIPFIPYITIGVLCVFLIDINEYFKLL